MRELMNDLYAASRQTALVRVLIVGSLVVFAMATLLAGSTSVWALIVLAVLGLTTAINPHGGLAGAVLVYLLLVWAYGVEDLWTVWSLIAALSILVFHTAVAVAAATPPSAVIPDAVFSRYAVRLGVVTAATVLVWGLAAVIEIFHINGGVVSGILGLLVLAVGLGLHYVTVTRPIAAETQRRRW